MFSFVFQRIPPWVCIPVAVVLFIVPTWWLGRSTGLLSGPLRLFGMAIGGIGALVCLAGGFHAHRQKQRQIEFLGENIDVSWAKQLDWRAFEKQLAAVYRQRGYGVEEIGGNGPDGGVDLRLTKAGEITLVQCKQWRTWKVGVKPMRELYGVLVAEGADRAVLVTSGEFTQEAVRFAEGKPIDLVNDVKLLGLLQEFQRDLQTQLGSGRQMSRPAALPSPSRAPSCPTCASLMVVRTATKGTNSGSRFWGCPNFPRCRGIRQYADESRG